MHFDYLLILIIARNMRKVNPFACKNAKLSLIVGYRSCKQARERKIPRRTVMNTLFFKSVRR